jgi:hypothetical protein
MNRDSIYKEFQETKRQMDGISRKLKLYWELVKKLEDLRQKLGGFYNGNIQKGRRDWKDEKIKMKK